MKTLFLVLIAISVLSPLGWCHEAPIPINQMQWVADPGSLQVRFRTEAAWWSLNVFGDRNPPPTHWPDADQKLAKDYFDRHFVLQADGKPINSELTFCRFSEEVWQLNGHAKLELGFSYLLPRSAQTISVAATFYKEERAENARFETHLSIDGAPKQNVVLTLDRPEFSFPLQEILRTPKQRWRDAWAEGLLFFESAPWLVFVFGAFQLQLRTRADRFIYSLGTLAVAGAGAFFLEHRAGYNSGYSVGAFLSLVAIGLLVELGLSIYRERLKRVSASQAELLFRSQIRFVSVLLVGMAFLLIAQYIPRS